MILNKDMILNKNYDIAAFILRVTLGAVLVAHSVYLKLFVFTLPGTAQFFASIGLPSVLAYLVFIVEAVGGVLLMFGVKTRYVALAIIPILIGAAWAHWGNGWLFTNTGGGWEYPLVLALMAAVQYFIGEGKYSLLKDR